MTQVAWWWVPVVAGLFALGGVFTTQLVVVRLDGLRVRREDSRRWLADRRRIYASLLASAEGLYERLKHEWTTDSSISEFREELTSLRVACQEIRLMSTVEVNAAGWEISETLGKATKSAESRRKISLDVWKDEYKEAVGRFVRCTSGSQHRSR
jgi:hypothetical protein